MGAHVRVLQHELVTPPTKPAKGRRALQQPAPSVVPGASCLHEPGRASTSYMPRNQTAVRLLIALFILLPFKVVAQVTLAAAAVVFFLQPFELSRVYALIAVSVVQMLARLHRWMEAQRVEEEEGNLAPALLQLNRLGRAYSVRSGFGTQQRTKVATALCSAEDLAWYSALPGSREANDELTLDAQTAAQLALRELPSHVRLVVLRREAPGDSGCEAAEERPAAQDELPPLGSRASYVAVQEPQRCISVSAECKGSPLTLEDVLFASRGLVPPDGPDRAYGGYELVGCSGTGVLTLRPQWGGENT